MHSKCYIPSGSHNSSLNDTIRAGISRITLEDITSKLDDMVLPKLNSMEEKYNKLLEKFTLQADENRVLKSEIGVMKKELIEFKSKNNLSAENIICEVNERSQRSKNVIIFDLIESNHENIKDRIDHDINLVLEILTPANIIPEHISKVL
ncbi:hypothetical protein HHI36_000246 [Cryptolaemus montrouzieri]|uniref:Uncharacterized protein n=1 Tax=Cryptolaemus montrouzieri TaxID=559131 RepID=A0ABD2P4T1_9CUCU